MSLVTLLVVIILLALVLYALRMLPMGEPFGTILQVIAILIAVVYIAKAFGVF